MRFFFLLFLGALISSCGSPQATPKPLRFGATASSVIPPSWTTAAWYIDPSNTTTCAADTNNCTSATCGATGIGPCLSFGEIAQGRWGTYSPRLRQNTTITFLSSQASGDSDPLYLDPRLENQASLFVTGTQTSVGTGTFTALTAKNRATPQQLTVTLSSGTGAAQYVQLVDTTNAGNSWLDTNTSGNIWIVTQPLVSAVTTAIGSGIRYGTTAAEVDTFASGDSYTLNTLPFVKIVEISPTVSRWSAGNGGGVYVSLMQIGDADNNNDPLNVGTPVLFGEVVFHCSPTGRTNTSGWSNGATSFAYMQEFYNTVFVDGLWYMGQGMDQPLAHGATALFLGGLVTGNEMQLGYVDLEQDIYLQAAHSGLFATSGAKVAGVYQASGTTLSANYGAGSITISTDLQGGNALIWGPGNVNIGTPGIWMYPSGAGGAAAAFLNTGTFTFAGTYTSCNIAYTADGGSGSSNVTLSAANLDSNLGATIGCCFQPGAGRICNHQ